VVVAGLGAKEAGRGAAVKCAVNFEDPDDVRRWLAAPRAEAEERVDLDAEAARKNEERGVSRVRARVELERTGRSLRKLLRAGRRGLPPKPPAHH
jgi:hypothetical protein